MTGGIEETYELKKVDRNSFFETLGNALAHDAMMVQKQFHSNLYIYIQKNVDFKMFFEN